jgi:hypothetical protein
MEKRASKKEAAKKELKKIDKDFQQRQKEFAKKVQGMNFEEFRKAFIERDNMLMECLRDIPKLINDGLLQPQLNNFISVIRKGNQNVNKDMKVSTTKSGKTRRVDMSKELSETLKVHLVERKKETLRKGWTEVPEWLFYNESGRIIDSSTLRQMIFSKILVKAGLRHIRIHDLRHTYATLRISKGDNIVDVSKQLGHHSVKITLDTYVHWIPGTKKSEVDGLDSQNETMKKRAEARNV